MVAALVAMLGCLNQQIAALEEQLEARFGAHPDAAILRSQPGLRVVLGARVLGEFGDDPDRYQSAKGRKAFAGTAPITRSSGLRTTVVARAACNQRLVDACYPWAFAALTASPAHADAMTPTAAAAPPTIRRCGRWATGWWASCTAARPGGSPTRSSWPGRPLDHGQPGCRGVQPPGDAGDLLARGRRCSCGGVAVRSRAMGRSGSSAGWVKRRRRRHRPAGEVGRLPRSRLTGATASGRRILHPA